MPMFHFRYEEEGRKNFGLKVIYSHDLDEAKMKWRNDKPLNLIKLVSIHDDGVYNTDFYTDPRYMIDRQDQ